MDFRQLFKLRLVVAAMGETHRLGWWNSGVLTGTGEFLFQDRLKLLSFQPGGEPLGSAHGQPSRPAFGHGVTGGGSRHPDRGGHALLQHAEVHSQLVVGERCVHP